MKRLVEVIAIFTVAGGTHAQRAEFIAPNAGFKSASTRAEVRMWQNEAYAGGVAAQGKHDGQDSLYVTEFGTAKMFVLKRLSPPRPIMPGTFAISILVNKA